MSLTQINVFNNRTNSRVEEYARNRLEMVVGRFHKRLGGIDIRVRDENAGKGGEDKTCSIDAHLVPRGTVHVQAKAADVYDAILKAVHRLEKVIAKSVDRGHRNAAVRHKGGGLRQESAKLMERSE